MRSIPAILLVFSLAGYDCCTPGGALGGNTGSGGGGAGASSDHAEVLKAINLKRQIHGAPALKWDPELERCAQATARKNCENGGIDHALNTCPGNMESLYQHCCRRTSGRQGELIAVDSWYEEAEVYCKSRFYTNPPYSGG